MVPPKLLHNGGIISDLSRPLLAPKNFPKCLRSCSSSHLSPFPKRRPRRPPLLTCIGQRWMSLNWRRREISHSQLRADSRKLEWQCSQPESELNSLSARQLRSAPESSPRSSGFVDFV